MTTSPPPAEDLQPGVDAPELWKETPEMEELTFVVPLLDKARAHLNRKVTVHISGDISVIGILEQVDAEDSTLTVRDGDDVYEIAVQHVAVIESQRRR